MSRRRDPCCPQYWSAKGREGFARALRAGIEQAKAAEQRQEPPREQQPREVIAMCGREAWGDLQ